MMKRKHINSGQYYAEEAMLKKINRVSMKHRKGELKPENIKYTMDLIIIEPEMTFTEISAVDSLSQICSFAEVDFTQKQSVFLQIKRPTSSLPLWVYGVYYIWTSISLILFWKYYQIQIIDFVIGIFFKLGVV